jgi:uncharacterized protein
MLGAGWTEAVALVAAFAIATVATPAGVSGAVLLLPFQVGVLGTPSPAVTPTNLLYNVIATPGALYRYWRQGQTGGRLAALLLYGTLPGVVAGSIIRVEVLPGARAFDFVIAAVLGPLGVWLIISRPTAIVDSAPAADPAPDEVRIPAAHRPAAGRRARELRPAILVALAALVGCVGGVYGIGGGSILAPVLLGAGRRAADVAPATLASTFVTSVAGVVTFAILAAHDHGSVAPDWTTGVALGVGGLVGGYCGARIQARLPETAIRRIVGVLVVAIGVRYLWSGLG